MRIKFKSTYIYLKQCDKSVKSSFGETTNLTKHLKRHANLRCWFRRKANYEAQKKAQNDREVHALSEFEYRMVRLFISSDMDVTEFDNPEVRTIGKLTFKLP